jgi:hypothetical protein
VGTEPATGNQQPATDKELAVKTSILRAVCAVALLVVVGATASAQETKRKRYTFDLDPRIRRASLAKAQTTARKQFLRDYLGTKFSSEIINAYAEDIDIALDPPDDYLLSFDVVSEKTNEDESQVTLTVEGVVDTASMIAKLVEQKVLSFGDPAPKIMVLPSGQFDDPASAKAVRALIYDKVKQAGLRPVAFEGMTQTMSIQVRPGGQLTAGDRKILIRTAVEYGADYLVYIDTQKDVRPFSQGGYISDANFTYTILRPNANLILGENIISARGSGSSAMLAFDRSLDEASPELASNMLGNLYESIYADSDVITSIAQIKTQLTLVVHEATGQQTGAITGRLRDMGATVNNLSGDGIVNRYSVEVSMDDSELYDWFAAQKWTVAGKGFSTPVVAFAENRIEIEVVPGGGASKRALAARPKPKPKAAGGGNNAFAGAKASGGMGSGGGGTTLASKAKITLKLRPAKMTAS